MFRESTVRQSCYRKMSGQEIFVSAANVRFVAVHSARAQIVHLLLQVKLLQLFPHRLLLCVLLLGFRWSCAHNFGCVIMPVVIFLTSSYFCFVFLGRHVSHSTNFAECHLVSSVVSYVTFTGVEMFQVCVISEP